MGREFSTMEVLKAPLEREEEDEFELSLELSIGGCYGKSDNTKNIEGKTRDPSEENDKGDNSNNHGLSRSDFSCGKKDVGAENGCEFVDLQKRRGIQASRRREIRMKREEKLKKSRVLNGEDKLILQAQQFQARVQDRETREKDGISEDSARKKEKNGTKKVVEDLNISLFTENKISGTEFASQQMQSQFLFPQVQYLPIGNGLAYPWVFPLWGPNVVEGEKNEKNVFRPVGNRIGSRNSSIGCDSGNEPENQEALSNRSVERSSSVVSDHLSTSQKGGSSSDTRSHSSSFGTHQNQCVSGSDKVEHLEVNDSSSPCQCVARLNPEESMKVVSSSIQPLKSSTSKITERSKAYTHSNQTNNTCSTTEKLSSLPSKETSGLINKPPKLPNHNQNGASFQHMPCVSTTGNGPNGKTITGFLYKYTKSEVSIMCVCHGSSFSPAEFVEHAGGIDVSHPLRHITIVPPALE